MQKEPHFHCRYAYKVRVLGPDFLQAEIWAGDENSVAHQSHHGEAIQQQSFKLPESVKDDIDRSRIDDKSTPRSFLACTLIPLAIAIATLPA